MKKTSANNRRKKLPLLLGALLIISVAAYGTRAYFSDSATQQADIKLELGNLDIESVDSLWKYTPENGKVNSALLTGTTSVTNNMTVTTENAKNITNVQPGDKFERIFEFKNVGSLEQNVTVKNTVSSNTDSIFNVNFEPIEAASGLSTNGIIKKDESVKYKMTISVNTDDSFDAAYNKKNNKTISGDTIFNALADKTSAETLLKNAVTVTANQVK